MKYDLDLVSSGIKVKKDIQLSDYTNTRTGGKISHMFYPHTRTELIQLIKLLTSKKIFFKILGEMTNVAVASGDLSFTVINMTEFEEQAPKLSGQILTVTASYPMKKLSRWAIQHNLKDFPWMEGIPGTVGAGIYMNAGFLPNEEIATYLISATYLDLDTLEINEITNQELKFRYRYSEFHKMNCIILEGKFLVNPIKRDKFYLLRKYKVQNKMTKYHQRRASHQPLELPSAGTVFVPPTPWHVGGFMRDLGMVGKTIGGAQISPKSPGFIVNIGDMTGEDYFSLVKEMQRQVKDHYDVDIVPEVRLYGFSEDLNTL